MTYDEAHEAVAEVIDGYLDQLEDLADIDSDVLADNVLGDLQRKGVTL